MTVAIERLFDYHTEVTLAADDLDTWCTHVLDADLPSGHTPEADVERIDLLRAMEDLKSTLCAQQAALAVAVDASQRAQQAARGVAPERRGRGVASQIALARRESPHRGGVLLGMAKDLTTELPHTFTALREGRLSEYRAQILVTETSGLDPVLRARIDTDLCADPTTLDGVGTRELEGRARRLAQTLDPAAACRRARRAVTERYVSVRPAPDTMSYVTALLPVAQGVAVYASLKNAADTARAQGDERTRSQVMADTFVERTTGQTTAEATPVAVDLVISDATLLGGGTEPATMPGYGPVPAEIARHLIAHAIDPATSDGALIRRLYADPAGRLVALTTTQRFATDALHTFLRVRDQGICRTAWCDAPAQHVDHVTDADHGGETSEHNSQGLCEACNHAKQALGWRQRTASAATSGRHRVDTITPTGHHYTSIAPPPPRPARTDHSELERFLEQVLRDHVAA